MGVIRFPSQSVGVIISNIDELQHQFLKADFNTSILITERLIKIGGEDIRTFFIKCLKSKDGAIRNRGASALKTIADQKSVIPLISSILDPVDPKNCANMVSALQTHDCSEHFVDIFKIMFYRNFECKLNAHNILSEQEFYFDNNDLLNVGRMWKECIENPLKCPGFDDLQEEIQSDVDSYLDFLDK